VDLNGAGNSLVRTNINGMSLVDAYKLLAGPAADPAAIARLADADSRLGKLTPVPPAQGGKPGSGSQERTKGPMNHSGATPEGLTQCQQNRN
jgi:hypothetical protein